jgi:D-arabinitol dehydrogenase (NADP+)
MKAVVFESTRKLNIREVDYPKLSDSDVIINVKACGVCGTDLHIFNGEFIAKFPLIPGHEFCGVVVEIGKNVSDVKVGDKVVVDNPIYCGECYYCKVNKEHFCLNFKSQGVTENGGFAEFVAVDYRRVHRFKNLSFEEAAFTEPTACAVHGLKVIDMQLGDEVLIFGAGPVGLILLQLLIHNGASKVVVACPTSFKLKKAKELGATDIVKIDRNNFSSCIKNIKKISPLGFDIVIDATGSTKVLESAFEFVKKGGKVHVFGVYPHNAKISIKPYQIFVNEIKIIGSFAQLYDFPPALKILENKVINVKKLISHTMKLNEFKKALRLMSKSHNRLKIIIKP